MHKKILSIILIVTVLFSLSSCGNTETQVFIKRDDLKEYSAFGSKGELTLSESDNLVKTAENEYLALYYDKETYVVTVFDKRTGKKYSTSHESETADKSNTRLAAINLIYSNAQGKTGTMDSYTKSVLLNQVETKTDGNCVTFIYTVGDVSDGLEVTPSLISNERFEELLEKGDDSQQKILNRRYSYMQKDDVWTRRKIANPTAAKELVQVFADLGYTSEDLAFDNAENGVTDSEDSKISFVIPLKFTLENDSVTASIELENVEYPQSNPLIQIEFLQFFGAAKSGDTGYFLLPDGSGAIMPFDTVESGAESYSAAVYGSDKALRNNISSAETQDILMPVYGASYTNGGFLAVIEDGEAIADILAYNSGSTDAYSKVYSRVNFLKTESVALGNQKSSDNFNYYHFQNKPYNGNYSVRYIFLEENNCDYSGMAAAYRSYLLSAGVINEKNIVDNSSIIIETIGGILSDKSFFGFKYKGITALTEYNDNLIIAETLQKEGIENINLCLTAFCGNGLQNSVPDKLNIIGNLGGTKEFKNLISYANDSLKIYPDFEYLTFSANDGVLNKNKYAARSMDSKALTQEIINYATLEKNIQIEDNLYYITAIRKLSEINGKLMKSLDKYEIGSIGISDMASGISSDYTETAAYDRQSAVNLSEKILKELSENYELMLSASNVRNAKYASLITEAPLWSSQYKFCEGIPFYQLVFHGIREYSGSAVNLSSNSKTEFLRCIEYGASLKYTVTYRNKSAIKNSDYTYLYSTGFEENKEEIISNYKAVNELHGKTANAQMISHTKLADSVYRTEYSNGVCTLVNYSANDYLSEYGTIEAYGYIIK